ncbi:transposase, IS4 [Roseobacter sp. AzwK-3b]|nr:transposase, IS4 [Roseobacter sp. AzwK-3b]
MNGRPVLLNFDGADKSSDAGLTLLGEVKRRANLAGLVAKCLPDPREPGKERHSLEDIIPFRIMMIAAGYEDGKDADDLRDEPSFKLTLERARETGAVLTAHDLADGKPGRQAGAYPDGA